MPDHDGLGGLTLIEALIRLADPEKWRRYCKLATARRLQPTPEAAARERLARRGKPGMNVFDFFGLDAEKTAAAKAMKPEPPLAMPFHELVRLEGELVRDFEEQLGVGRFHGTGFVGPEEVPVRSDWFRRGAKIDLGENSITLPSGTKVAGVLLWTVGPDAAAASTAQTDEPEAPVARQRTRPPVVKDAVSAWLWQLLENDKAAVEGRSAHQLAASYVAEPGAIGSEDYVRKLIGKLL